jgi:DMSO/TMAO reductase YedYZ heme-binding membrane subunit
MGWALGVGVTVGMILLRLIVPLAITVALSYALHRLDARWHPEATVEN